MTTYALPQGIGAKALAAAQALSEKFGIATFDLQGKVNTIPKTVPLSNINVGSGSTGLTSKSLNDYLRQFTPQTALIPPKIIDGQRPTITKEQEKNIFSNPSAFITPSLSTTLQQSLPILLLGGLVLAGLMVIKH